MGEDNVGKMEEEARKRRERIKAMRRQKREIEDSNNAELKGNSSGLKESLPKPHLKLRNYTPMAEDLKESKLKPAEPGKVEEHIKEHLESQMSAPTIEEDVDLFKLAPRKPDWDLKRDIQPKLERLERRTQRAIADIIRERLKQSAIDDPSNLAKSVEVEDVPRGGYESD